MMRWLANDNSAAGRKIKWAMARYLNTRVSLPIVQGNRTVHYVMRHLKNQRCPNCRGRKLTVSETGVYAACLTCNSSGMIGPPPANWSRHHLTILRESLASIGREHFLPIRAAGQFAGRAPAEISLPRLAPDGILVSWHSL